MYRIGAPLWDKKRHAVVTITGLHHVSHGATVYHLSNDEREPEATLLYYYIPLEEEMTTMRQLIKQLRDEGDPAAEDLETALINQAFTDAALEDRLEVKRLTSPADDGSWDATIGDIVQ